MHIHLNRNTPVYKPLKVFTATLTPLHLKQQSSKLISQLEASGVTVKVSPNENVERCSSSFFVPKPIGDIRLVTDYKHLNQYIDRPVHPFRACKDILRGIKSDSQWFLKFDAAQGYHQILLDEESS